MAEKILLLNRQKKIHLEKKYLENGISVIERYIPRSLKKINVVLVSDGLIKKLNKKFLNKNDVTDVLSFDLGSKGEIIISVETAKKQALDVFHSVELEILYLIIHGILHLSGFNDIKPVDYMRMKKQQDKIFSKIIKDLNAEQ